MSSKISMRPSGIEPQKIQLALHEVQHTTLTPEMIARAFASILSTAELMQLIAALRIEWEKRADK